MITLDGENANLVASGQRYYVYLDQISIAELGRNIVVSINGECTFTYSVLNYIALVRDSDKVDEDALFRLCICITWPLKPTGQVRRHDLWKLRQHMKK